MASPPLQNGHPSTPPSSDPAPAPAPTTAPSQPTTLPTAPSAPTNSLDDDASTKRPRDARLIHLVLSSLGIHSYQERVPLQLLDFAYRYTSSVLSDTIRLASDGYQGTERAGGGRRAGASGEDSAITVTALRQAIASRTGYHFHPGGALPKEFMLEQAAERNKVALPKVERGYGVLLPPEKYCLTGVGWGLKDEWDSEEEVDEEVEPKVNGVRSAERDDEDMGGVGAEEEDEEGVGRMEDVFGEEGEGDTEMAEG